jgi:Protein of unknown function (DUF2924)
MAPRPQWRRKGRPRANSAACDCAEALSSTTRQRPDAGSQARHDVLASPPASDRAPGSDVADRLARLETLDLSAMRQEWRRLYRAEPPRLSRDLMTRALAYRIQEIAFGGLSKATLRRLASLAAEFESDGRIATPARPRIKPGARLVREWHGRTHAVVVTEEGFEFERKLYRSLTGVAREITGAAWSGPRFFGLARAANASGRNDAPLGKSDWDRRRVDDPSQRVEPPDA